jgi:hypothetical protein
MSMRRWILLSVLFASCGSEQSLEHDLDAIKLDRAPMQPGGDKLGGLLALVETNAGLRPLLVDTAFPYNSLARGDCPSTPGWTYTGRMAVHDGSDQTDASAPLRADFTNVGLFDICPGPTGDRAMQPFGVLGGPLLANFAVDFRFPRIPLTPSDPPDPASLASMTLWPGFPGSDDQLAENGQVPLRFEPRGSFSIAQGDGEASLALPNSRVVLSACAAPRVASAADPAETCLRGESGVRSSGENMLLAIGTGEGPLILSQSAWERLAAKLGLAPDAGTPGELFTPFFPPTSEHPPTARFVSLPRLALFQGTTDSSWMGPCSELARARRIEWVLANQENGSCFQPCDVSGEQPYATRPYLELAGPMVAAIVPDTNDIIRSLNADVAAKPHIDGIVGAATLAGTRLRIDYQATPQGRAIANCLDGETRDTCFAAPSCPGLGQNQEHTCFGHPWKRTAPACKQP